MARTRFVPLIARPDPEWNVTVDAWVNPDHVLYVLDNERHADWCTLVFLGGHELRIDEPTDGVVDQLERADEEETESVKSNA